MTSSYRNMFAAFAVALLCLVSVSRSAPLDCKDLVRTLDQVDPRKLEGRWAAVAGSLKIIQAEKPPTLSDSVRIDFYNLTYIQANLFGQHCRYFSHDISITGPTYSFQVGQMFNFSGTFYDTSCPDCVVFTLVVDSPNYKSEELYLFSKRREVDQKEMQEFIAQVACLNMPEHFVMDPTKKLCPNLAAVAAPHTEEKANT